MNASWKNRLPLTVAVALVAVAAIVVACWQPARAAREDAANTFPRYSVVETEGHNLIVTDNQKNTLYFYTIGKDKKIGDDLELRGTVDLKQVGHKKIKIKKAGSGK
jgi:hypothetical protein